MLMKFREAYKRKQPVRPIGGGLARKQLSSEDVYRLNELYWEKGFSKIEARVEVRISEGVMDRHMLSWRDWVKFKNEHTQAKEIADVAK